MIIDNLIARPKCVFPRLFLFVMDCQDSFFLIQRSFILSAASPELY
jgi:hypothetical protein